ncbi:MAG: sugar phosphate nucleotidyltransferase, partial [Patescibacteria group bacterium]
MDITTLVLPVAGLGKRLLPLTEHTPKALLAVGGKPCIEYVLEEGWAAGIRDAVLVINPSQQAHFEKYIARAQAKFPEMNFRFAFQEQAFGSGEAILEAARLLEGKPFTVRFCDDILIAEENALRSLLDFFEEYRAPMILLERVPREVVARYGIVATAPVP